MALAEQSLGAAGVARGALGPALDRAERGLALGLGGVGGAGDREALRRGAEPGVDLPQLLLQLARALGRSALGRAEVERQRAEFGPQALQRRRQLALAIAEGDRPHRDPLLLAAQLGQQAPGLGALAVAGREALLGGAAAGADLGQPLLDPGPLAARLLGRPLGGLRPVGAEAQLLGDEPAAQLELLALDPRPQLCRLSLALQRPQPRPRLALEVERPVEVVASRAQLQLGPAAAFAVLAEPRGLLDQQPPLARLGVDDRLDPSLADHRVHLASQVGVGEHLDHVDEAAAGAVEAVDAVAGAVEAAPHGDLRELGRGAAVGVVDRHLDLGGAAPADALAPGRDHVLHRGAADRARALLAERPQDRVGDVRLARAVGADDHADARRELQPGPLGERLEPLHLDRSQIHLSSSSRRLAFQSDATDPAISRGAFSASSAAILLGRLLAAARPVADPLGVDRRLHLEGPPVRRAGFGYDGVAYARPAAGEQLLQGGLRSRPGTRAACSIWDANAAATAGAVRSKPKATKQAPISASVASGSGREPPSRTSAGIASSACGSASSSISGTPSSRPTSAQETPLTAWLWIFVRLSGAELGEALVEVGGDRQREHAVAEVGEALVGLLDPVLGPGGVGEGAAAQVVGQLCDQGREAIDAHRVTRDPRTSDRGSE